MKGRRILWIVVVIQGLIFSFVGESPASEKKFPTKSIQLIIPFQPGNTDNLLRPFIDKLPTYLGQPIVFVFKPGAGGALGTKFAASSKADGYTLIGASTSPIVVIPLNHSDAGYTWESFAPISSLAASPVGLFVLSNAPWKNIKGFVDEAKKFPGQISYASAGRFTTPHLVIEAFSKEAGIKLNHIPNQGAGPSVTALLGGHVQAASVPVASAFPHIKAGSFRALVVYDPKRARVLSDVPTLLEMGYSTSFSSVSGILAPKDAPKEVIETIHQATQKVIKDHSDYIIDRLDKIGCQISLSGPEEFKNILKQQYDHFSHLIKDLKQ